MIFRNSIKILINKFSLIAQILIFQLVILIIVSSIGISLFLPYLNSIKNLGYVQDIRALISGFNGSGMTLGEVANEISNLIQLIIDQLGQHSVNVILTLFTIFVAGRLLLGLEQLAIAACLEGFMSSNAKISFFRAFVANIKKSLKFQIFKIILTLPFDLIILSLTILTSNLLSMASMAFLKPLILSGIFVLLNSLKNTMFCTWPSYILLEKTSSRKGMQASVRHGFTKFGAIYSMMVMVFILSFAANIFLFVFTLGVGIFVSVPMTILFYEIVSMTVYYYYSGKRYYVDKLTVVTPPATEITDNFDQA